MAQDAIYATEAAGLRKAGAVQANPDLICFSHLRWHFVTQRPQHLLTRAALDRRVFFWEEPIWHEDGDLPLQADGTPGMHLEITQEGSSLWIIQPHITWGIDFEDGQRLLLADFMVRFKINQYAAWYYTPMAFRFSSHLRPQLVIYDCMDELGNFLNAPIDIKQRERELLHAADVVFTGGRSLFEAKQGQHSNVHAFPSSIDAAHFAKARRKVSELDPADQMAIPTPRAGFYGVIDERLDLTLLAALARLRPEVHFVMLGPVVKIDPSYLPQAPNLHYLGSKSYDELPEYLPGWDAALLPFAINDATRFISPTKTPEYLAAGKQVISTPIRDVVREYGDAGLVAIAETAEDFATALDAALLEPNQKWRDAVAAKLQGNSWDATWAAMQREMSAAETKKVRKSSNIEISTEMLSKVSAKHSAASAVTAFRYPTKPTLAPRGTSRAEKIDYLVVGAGFAGSVLAERLSTQLGKRVLLIDKRDHVAGNAYDFYNSEGILVHKYGPHIFHTNSDDVVGYLSQFTSWRPYEHRVLASVDGQQVPVPINLDTINRLYGLELDGAGMQEFLAARVVVNSKIRTSEDIVLSRVGRELYEKFFRNYTRKQWGLDPSQLDSSVAGRIPVRFDRDDRYFADSFQAMPSDGYTRMFERMLDQKNLRIETGVEYQDVARSYPNAKVIFTGPIDEYFDFKYGPLPYRSLEFKHETHDREVFQDAPVVNYPNDHEYTRVTEFKYLTGQKHRKTSVVYEYPRSEGDPYYPIPRPENAAIFAKYRGLAERDSSVTFCGRLANYRYFNMDQVVAQALTTFRQLALTETTNEATNLSVGELTASKGAGIEVTQLGAMSKGKSLPLES